MQAACQIERVERAFDRSGRGVDPPRRGHPATARARTAKTPATAEGRTRRTGTSLRPGGSKSGRAASPGARQM